MSGISKTVAGPHAPSAIVRAARAGSEEPAAVELASSEREAADDSARSTDTGDATPADQPEQFATTIGDGVDADTVVARLEALPATAATELAPAGERSPQLALASPVEEAPAEAVVRVASVGSAADEHVAAPRGEAAPAEAEFTKTTEAIETPPMVADTSVDPSDSPPVPWSAVPDDTAALTGDAPAQNVEPSLAGDPEVAEAAPEHEPRQEVEPSLANSPEVFEASSEDRLTQEVEPSLGDPVAEAAPEDAATQEVEPSLRAIRKSPRRRRRRSPNRLMNDLPNTRVPRSRSMLQQKAGCQVPCRSATSRSCWLPLYPRSRMFPICCSKANRAIAADRLLMPVSRSAYGYLKRALAIDPGNADARRGIDRIVAAMRISR